MPPILSERDAVPAKNSVRVKNIALPTPTPIKRDRVLTAVHISVRQCLFERIRSRKAVHGMSFREEQMHFEIAGLCAERIESQSP